MGRIVARRQGRASLVGSRGSGLAAVAVVLVLLSTGCAYVSRVSDSGSPTAPLARSSSESSDSTSLSADGRFVAFSSFSPDIIPNDPNGVDDVFVRDRTSGAVEAASVSSSGTLGSSGSSAPQISPNGRFVVFESAATNIVLSDTNGQSDVFLRDRQAGTTVRVSLGAGSAQAVGGPSGHASVSSDGRYVAFISGATNLVAGDTNNFADVFLRDLQTGTTTRVSVGAGGVQSNGTALTASMSADGRYVAFSNDATNLVAGDTNGLADVFVRDRQAATTTRVSVATGGAQATASSLNPVISADGRYIAFDSTATNLVAGDTNAVKDVFLRDRTGATTTRASVATGGAQANGSSTRPAISSDGRYVSFSSTAASLNATPLGTVFRRDRTSGMTIVISQSTAGVNAAGVNEAPSISGDGSIVGFTSSASTLTTMDSNGSTDAFDRVIATSTTEIVSRHGSFQGNGPASSVSMSLDGRYVAFDSNASDLVPYDTNGTTDVFVRDTRTGVVQLVSAAVSTGLPAAGESYEPSISSDGHWVAFSSTAENLSAFDQNGVQDVFLRNLDTGVTRLISYSSSGIQANAASSEPTISGDGTFVAFTSFANNLVAGDSNGRGDVFVRDWTSATTASVSVAVGGALGDFTSEDPAISPDGRFVAFESSATNLVTGDTNAGTDVFLRDRTAATTSRLSVTSAGIQVTNESYLPRISADARYVTFTSAATTLVTGDTNAVPDIFVRDRQSATTTRVSVGAGGAQATMASAYPVISGDGRYVAFLSLAPNLVAGDTNGVLDVFVRDQVAGRTTRVSTDTNLAQGNGVSGQDNSSAVIPAISVDGRYVGFTTQATNLVTPDVNGAVNDLVIRANPVPTITSATPATVARGATATITVNGTYFLAGVSSYFGDGITVNTTNRVSESQVKFTIKVAATAATGNRTVLVYLPGTGPGALSGAAAQVTLKIT